VEHHPGKRVKREFRISSFAVDNRTSVFVLAIMILIVGVTVYSSMPRESFPEITQPEIYVGTVYPGNSPIDMENLITRPIEKELKGLTGVDEMTSTSIQDYSTIIVSFNFDVPVSEALQDVKDAVDRAKPELPSDLDTDPDIFELDFSDIPIMNVNLSGDLSMEELREHAEYLQDKIEDLRQIKEVDIRGVLEQEINIMVDIQKMESALISFSDIEAAVFQENVTMSGGDILTDGFRRNMRVVGEFKSVEEIENIIVKRDRGNFVYLKDIAEVEFGYEDRQSFARLDGNPVVTLDIKKQSGENIIVASDAINEIVDDAVSRKFPKDIEVSITGDQSTQTQKMVKDLENNIISGVILVVIVLLFFLGLRNALFVGIAIPLSMVMGILWLGTSGVTLNMMVLFSLILALGMLVDNAIVVVENIYRLHSEGMKLKQAAKEGVGEVAWPIIASTATTLAAFLPLLFWKSIMGEFMKFLPLTLILILSSSLFVGLVINPVLTSVFMRIEESKRSIFNKRFIVSMSLFLLAAFVFYWAAYMEIGANATFKALGSACVLVVIMVVLNKFILAPASRWFRTWFMPRLESVYHNSLVQVLKGWRPFAIFGGTFVLLFASIGYFFLSDPEIIYMPGQEPQYINVFIEMPLGTDIEQTNKLTMQVEQRVEEAIAPYRDIVDAVLAQVGEGTSDPMDGVQIGASPHKARVNVSFLEFDKRGGITTSLMMEDIRNAISDIPGAKFVVDQQPIGPPAGKHVNIEVSGENYEELIQVADYVTTELTMMDVEGIEGLKMDLETGKPELLIDVDRDAARRFGLSTVQIAAEIRTSLFGKEISKYKIGEDDYPIILRSNEEARNSLPKLLNKKVTFQNMDTGVWLSVPISSVADVQYTSGYGSVKRKDMDRVITIASNVKIQEGYNPTEINNIYKEAMKSLDIPEGYTVSFTGEQEEQAETLAFLTSALMIAIFLIFLILVSQFNSLISPAIVLFSVLFSTIGVFLGLAIFKMPFVALMTGIGIISLAGIVVNNAIVLIDYTNLIRQRRRAELDLHEDERLPWSDVVHSITKGGETRLRPVLLTAITTILGLIPLAIGINIDFGSLLSEFDPKFYLGGDNVAFWGPMSWTVIFGLIFATFLTLFVVPVMYLLSDKLKDFLLGIKRKRQERRRLNGLAG
jgi:multidrug efflux pump subunit AcrB